MRFHLAMACPLDAGRLLGDVGSGSRLAGGRRERRERRVFPLGVCAVGARFVGGVVVGEGPGPAGVHAGFAAGDVGGSFGAFEYVFAEAVAFAGAEHVEGEGFAGVVEQVGAEPFGGVALLVGVFGGGGGEDVGDGAF